MDDMDTIIDGTAAVFLCVCLVLAYILSYTIEPAAYTTTHAEVYRE